MESVAAASALVPLAVVSAVGVALAQQTIP